MLLLIQTVLFPVIKIFAIAFTFPKNTASTFTASASAASTFSAFTATLTKLLSDPFRTTIEEYCCNPLPLPLHWLA